MEPLAARRRRLSRLRKLDGPAEGREGVRGSFVGGGDVKNVDAGVCKYEYRVGGRYLSVRDHRWARAFYI